MTHAVNDQVKNSRETTDVSFYSSPFAHISDELRKLDLLLLRQLLLVKHQETKNREIAVDTGLYVSGAEVEALLREPGEIAPGPVFPQIEDIETKIKALQQEIDARLAAGIRSGVVPALRQLVRLFDLSPFEVQVVIICLAPELRRKYDKIFVYLQDDIGRKRPSIDLVLELLCRDENDRWAARVCFSDHAPLIRAGIIDIITDTHNPSASSDLARFIKLSPRILNFLLGNNAVDGRLLDLVKLDHPSLSWNHLCMEPEKKQEVKNIIANYLEKLNSERQRLVFYFHGPGGVGKQDLGQAIGHHLQCYLVYLDMEQVLPMGAEAGKLLRLAFREGLLFQAILYIDHVDSLLAEEPQSKALLKFFAQVAAEWGWLTILAGEKPWSAGELFTGTLFYSVAFSIPPVNLRHQVWTEALAGIADIVKPAEPADREDLLTNPDQETDTSREEPAAASGSGDSRASWSQELARQFSLTPAQIRGAVSYAYHHCVVGNHSRDISLENLYTACRHQSNSKLSELALKIEPRYGWENIVLPDDKITQLQEICSQVRYRYRVYTEWGFREKISHGRGISVLFSGTPGTGKTMAAEVMAHELRLDLYKIDLSRVVSKYIGETEKNLAGIFHEAETSNAILFFDEADALFGKRTEVADAHDRYANIETSYLLQKMEEYEGVVILATNFRKNMDDAFIRRIRFIVEFPFPDEQNRLSIWKTHFPQDAPVSSKIDYEFLSREFRVPGGSIRNIVLMAAFFAAQDGGIISMAHLLKGARREYEKIGKLWDPGMVPREAGAMPSATRGSF